MTTAADPEGPVAILLSGNGGWWSLDEGIAGAFRRAGISTVGWNSLAYFIHRRTPVEVASDIDRVAGLYSSDRDLLLVGYSFGADIAATVYSRLSPATRSRIRVVSLLGLSRVANYSEGIWKLTDAGQTTVAAVNSIEGPQVQCFRGLEEGERSACGLLDSRHVELVSVPGGHHFDGNYAAIAARIIDALRSHEPQKDRIAIIRRTAMMAHSNGTGAS